MCVSKPHIRTRLSSPSMTLILKPSVCQLHLPLLMLFQSSRPIQGHEHQGSLFLCRALVCVCVCVCIRKSVCMCVCASMSMSSLLTNPSHPSDTVTLSTLCFLSPSDWLPPWREPRTHQIMLFFHRETDLYTSAQSQHTHMYMRADTYLWRHT